MYVTNLAPLPRTSQAAHCFGARITSNYVRLSLGRNANEITGIMITFYWYNLKF